MNARVGEAVREAVRREAVVEPSLQSKTRALSRLPIDTNGDHGPGSPYRKTHGSILTMDPVHSKALDAVLAQTSTDKQLSAAASTNNQGPPTLQRRPSLDGGAARRAAQDVAAIEATAERRMAEARGAASTTATLRLVSRLLAQDETICRCHPGSEVSGGGTTRQGADDRFRIRVESKGGPRPQMLEAIQLRTAKQQAAASPQIVRKAPVTSPLQRS